MNSSAKGINISPWHLPFLLRKFELKSDWMISHASIPFRTFQTSASCKIWLSDRFSVLQGKFVSAHQAEIQFAKTLLVKMWMSGNSLKFEPTWVLHPHCILNFNISLECEEHSPVHWFFHFWNSCYLVGPPSNLFCENIQDSFSESKYRNCSCIHSVTKYMGKYRWLFEISRIVKIGQTSRDEFVSLLVCFL